MDRAIVSRSGVGASGPVLQKTEVRLARVMFDNPTLVLVRRGQKILRNSSGEVSVGPGQAVAIAGGEVFDVANLPGHDCPYESAWIGFYPELISLVPSYATAPVKQLLHLGSVEPAFADCFHRAREAISALEEIPNDIALERVRELLVWVRLHGGHFVNPPVDTLTKRVRLLVSQAPQQNWNSERVARHVAMSEATLRRHLAAEGVSLSELLTEVRMNHALSLIQSTDLPIAHIAENVGYESPSRFAVRFRQRFGHSPTFVRGQREARKIISSAAGSSGIV